MFQIVRLALDDNGEVNARRPLQPLFELREDAMAMAEFDASRLWGDYGCDDERDGWWATDARGRKYRFVVEPVAAADLGPSISPLIPTHSASLRAFTPVFDGLWTRVNALKARTPLRPGHEPGTRN